MNSIQPRVLLAAAVTVVALVAIAVISLSGSDSESTNSPTTSSGGRGATTSVAPRVTTTSTATTTTSIEIPEDWYPKGSSRYSDRSPATTVTTLPPSSDTTGDDLDSGSVKDDGPASNQSGSKRSGDETTGD
ncbi:MAG: hypothetical protein V9F03_15750 [Microthrixaceae bacterium]